MKEIIKERTNVEHYVVYQANDGTEFASKEECITYDNSARCVLREKFMKLVVKPTSWLKIVNTDCCENTIYAIMMPTEKDRDNVLQYYYSQAFALSDGYYKWREQGKAFIDEAFENNDILLVGENCDGDIYIISTRQSIINNLNNLDKKDEAK